MSFPDDGYEVQVNLTMTVVVRPLRTRVEDAPDPGTRAGEQQTEPPVPGGGQEPADPVVDPEIEACLAGLDSPHLKRAVAGMLTIARSHRNLGRIGNDNGDDWLVSYDPDQHYPDFRGELLKRLNDTERAAPGSRVRIQAVASVDKLLRSVVPVDGPEPRVHPVVDEWWASLLGDSFHWVEEEAGEQYTAGLPRLALGYDEAERAGHLLDPSYRQRTPGNQVKRIIWPTSVWLREGDRNMLYSRVVYADAGP